MKGRIEARKFFSTLIIIVLVIMTTGCTEKKTETTGTEVISDLFNDPWNATIEFTYVPPISSEYNPNPQSYNYLRGRVSHVNPADWRVAVYIYVNFGWRTKPYLDNTTTIILPNGTWACDITTGGIDYAATEIAAFLIQSCYYPPLMEGKYNVPLPYNLYKFSVAHVNTTRSL
ncbi:MAG: hypothetical protein NTU58_01395 [Candidatus Nealsonbacteria bacterium]|nr:hypothetical protein [Candidatus Nealsonbacteria bacterium]